MPAEQQRLDQSRGEADWKIWGPYLAERAWGTVREDYSADGSAWTYFPHDHARSRVYRWNEDGLLGISDRRQYLCFALALWNGRDPILKERAFGLSGPEGNHGEDVKEYYYFLDSTPTHSYMKALYKYPQAAYPYGDLVAENARRRDTSRELPEYELMDTGVFADNRYYDVTVEYAKASPEDVLIRITVTNHGPEPATLHLLPTLWLRNTWSWGTPPADTVSGTTVRPTMGLDNQTGAIEVRHEAIGAYTLTFDAPAEPPLFTDNDTNTARLFNQPNASPYVKDAFHRYFVEGDKGAVNPNRTGTKAMVPYVLTIPPGQSRTVRLRLAKTFNAQAPNAAFDALFAQRHAEADEFFETLAPPELSADHRLILRQACAGLLWSKQFYHYDVHTWLTGDTAQPAPPPERWRGRNCDWQHVVNDSVLSMPDTWEFPWYAAWDLAFHTIALALVDPDFAKRQLILLLREWFMHPNGQLPAYEWQFGDVNPPVHAWAALRVYKIERRIKGKGDRAFLERVFQKLLINFTWWVNRKDRDGRNVFQGGFLGLDNIGLFDRSEKLPSGTTLDQSDGTAWMAMFCLNMLAIAIELAMEDPAYEDVATKFLEHFFHIAHAMNDRPATMYDQGIDLWDDEDGFYYDVMHRSNGEHVFLKIHSMVGLIPLLAVEVIEPETFEKLPDFARRLHWFMTHRGDLCKGIASLTEAGQRGRILFSIVNEDRLRSILTRMLDESEFLSPYGVRSVSRYHKDNPLRLELDGKVYTIDYEPAESRTSLFGGNSNWRGPIWFPINYLLIESLQKFDFYFGDAFKVQCPTGAGAAKTLWDTATDLSQRLIDIFARSADGRRAVFGANETFQRDPLWRDLLPFHEYFHGDTAAGLGASHQTGWTGLIAKLITQSGTKPERVRAVPEATKPPV